MRRLVQGTLLTRPLKLAASPLTTRSWLLALVLVSTAAHAADGVPFFTAGPPIPASSPINSSLHTKWPNFVSQRPIVVNRAAFDATVVTAELNGRVYTFTGHIQPKLQLPNGTKELEARWYGEDGPNPRYAAVLGMKRSYATGEVMGGIFIPPNRSFVVQPGVNACGPTATCPTVLLELLDANSGVEDEPYLLRLFVMLSILTVIVADGIYLWRQPLGAISTMSPSAFETPTRVARANAAGFLFVWALFCCVLWSLGADDVPKPAHQDEKVFGTLLLVAVVGASIVFWRVRSAYRAGTVSMSRAVVEGSAAAAALYLFSYAGVVISLSPGDLSWNAQAEQLPDDAVAMLIFINAGAIFGAVFWLANRYALSRCPRVDRPSQVAPATRPEICAAGSRGYGP